MPVSRRDFLRTSLAATAVAVSGCARPAKRTTAARGPAVWLDMDQAELDAAYTQGRYAPNISEVLARYVSRSDAVRQRLGEPRRHSYGATPTEALDLYATGRANAPIQVFIHGGAWRSERARDYGFPAELFVNAGAHYVVPDFITVTEANGNLVPMAEQVRRAIAWVYRNARSFGGDPERIYLSGHSSGGHLAGVALITDWRRDFDIPADVIKGALLCSGLYDLKPVRLSVRSSYIRFTDEMEQVMSTQRYVDRITTPIVLAYGSLETPEFQRQSRDFAAALRTQRKPVQILVAERLNHFEILETIVRADGLLGRAALSQMTLA